MSSSNIVFKPASWSMLGCFNTHLIKMVLGSTWVLLQFPEAITRSRHLIVSYSLRYCNFSNNSWNGTSFLYLGVTEQTIHEEINIIYFPNEWNNYSLFLFVCGFWIVRQDILGEIFFYIWGISISFVIICVHFRYCGCWLFFFKYR